MDLQIINVTEKDSITTIHLDQMDNGLINMSAISEMLDVLRYIEDESKCKFIGIELNKKYCNIAKQRIRGI